MAKVTIYGSPFSTCTQFVIVACYERGIDFDIKFVNLMKGEQKSPKHLALQPFGKVPAIDDGGFILYESQAIVRYLDSKAGAKLIPSDIKDAAMSDQWTSNFTSYYNSLIAKIVSERLIAPLRGMKADEAVIAKAVGDLKPMLLILNGHLANNHYVAGACLTMGDLVALPYFNYLFQTPEGTALLDEFKHISAWFQRISQHESWLKVRELVKQAQAQMQKPI